MKTLEQLWSEAGTLWQHKGEWVKFMEWVRANEIKSVLEIGTGLGGSAFCFGELTDHGTVVSVDFDQQGAARIAPTKRRSQPNPNFVQVHGDSRTDETEAVIRQYGPADGFDLVYFDTEHAEADVRDNYARYGKMAKRFIAQHDINMDEVNWPDAGIPKVWREVKQGKISIEIINPSHDPRFPRWGGIGVLWV